MVELLSGALPRTRAAPSGVEAVPTHYGYTYYGAKRRKRHTLPGYHPYQVLRVLLDCLTPTHDGEGGGERGERGEGREGRESGERGEGGESEGSCSGGGSSRGAEGGSRGEGGSPLCDASARGVLLEAGVA